MAKEKKMKETLEEVVVEGTVEMTIAEPEETILMAPDTASIEAPKSVITPSVELLAKVIKDTGLNERGTRFGKCLVKTNPAIGGYTVVYGTSSMDFLTLEEVALFIAGTC